MAPTPSLNQKKQYTEIELTKGKTTKINIEDHEIASKYSWCADRHGDLYYAMTKLKNGKTLRLHQLILGKCLNKKLVVDHINGDGLDNRRNNLRYVQKSTNFLNCKSKSFYFDKHKNKYICRIVFKGITFSIGRFSREIDAIKASKCFRIKLLELAEYLK